MGFFSQFFKTSQEEVSNSFVKLPIFNEVLGFPLPEQWPVEPALRTLEGGTFVVEFHAPEDADNKIIVQGFNNANVDVELNARKLLKMMRDEMQALDESAFYSEELFSETKVSRQKIIVIMGLKSLPDDQEVAQFGLYALLEGSKDIYIVQRSWKGKPNSDGFLVPRQELLRWLEDFKAIELSALETLEA